MIVQLRRLIVCSTNLTVSRLAECGTTKEDITEAAARLQGARARLLGTTATSWPGLLYR